MNESISSRSVAGVAACHVGAKAERHAAPSPAPEIESGTVDVYHADGHAPAAFGGNIYNGL